MSEKSDLTKVTPPKELSEADNQAVFERLSRRLASFRNTAELYANAEAFAVNTKKAFEKKDAFVDALNEWAQETLKNVWLACREPGGGMFMILLYQKVMTPILVRRRSPTI